MAKRQHKPLNPYIAGSALDGATGFFGRADILRLVESELRSPHQNAVVLFGQRRIGKTSILLQLRRRLPDSGFLPVYLDLMDRARRPMGALLAELAGNVAHELGLEPPEANRFDDEGSYFRQGFLPSVYGALGEDEAARRLVFLFDEFDVLDVAAAEELPEAAAARAFFPYLRQLMSQEKRLGFVIVVGRKTEELSTDFRAAFRAARYQKVSVLEEGDAGALIHLAEEEGSLRYTPAAVERILALTAAHPFFTQLTCFLLFNRAWAGNLKDEGVPLVDAPDVDAIVPRVLEAGNSAFEWVWDGLPSAERIIFSTIAEGTDEGRVLNKDQIVEVLQQHGIRIFIRELELAPRTLVDWGMLRQVDGGYRFFIELMRRWVAKSKPLARVRDELDRVIPLADQLYQVGHTFYRQENLEGAMAQLRQAVAINPNHLKARLLLGTCLREQGDLAAAVEELEWAYEYDAQAARYELVRTLLQQGEGLEKEDAEDEALTVYERVLEISPRERVARERRAAIYVGRGDTALEAGDYDAALAAYEQAGAREKLREAAARKRKVELEDYARRGEKAAEAEDWETAVEVYEWLVAQAADDSRWKEALDGARREQRLAAHYTKGLGAVEQEQWALARRELADVVNEQPDYKEATRYLHLAVTGVDAVDLQAKLETERKARQEAEAAARQEASALQKAEERIKRLRTQLESEEGTRRGAEVVAPGSRRRLPRGSGGVQTAKLVVTGPFGAGKTQFIQSISEIDVVATERKITSEAERIKDETTVAMDLGRITVDEDLVLYLFGTPGQKRFDFMWEILSGGMLGFVVLIDSARPETFREAKRILEVFRGYAPTPCVVAANKQDQEGAWSPEDLRVALKIDRNIKVLPLVATDEESVRNVLLELLYSILGEMQEVIKND